MTRVPARSSAVAKEPYDSLATGVLKVSGSHEVRRYWKALGSYTLKLSQRRTWQRNHDHAKQQARKHEGIRLEVGG